MPWNELNVTIGQSRIHYSSNKKITTVELYLWWQNTHYFFVFSIESTQVHNMLCYFYGLVKNWQGIFVWKWYRSTGGATVRVKCWVCCISSTVMVVRYTCLTVWMVYVLTLGIIGHLSFWLQWLHFSWYRFSFTFFKSFQTVVVWFAV